MGKKNYNDWGKANQGEAFDRMHKTMKKQFVKATEDFSTIKETTEKLYTHGQKVRMGSIVKKR